MRNGRDKGESKEPAKDLKDTPPPKGTIRRDIFNLAHYRQQLSPPLIPGESEESVEQARLLDAALQPERNSITGIVKLSNGAIRLCTWDLSTGENKVTFCEVPKASHTLSACLFPRSNQFILVRDSSVTLTDPSNKDPKYFEFEHGQRVIRVKVMHEANWLVASVCNSDYKKASVVIWDLHSGKQLMNRDDDSMFSGFRLLRILSNKHFAISSSLLSSDEVGAFHDSLDRPFSQTELWDVTSYADPKVIIVPGFFLRETKDGVVTWDPQLDGKKFLRLFDRQGRLINSCQLFVELNLDYNYMPPDILNLPHDDFLLRLGVVGTVFEALYHFNRHLELCSVTEVEMDAISFGSSRQLYDFTSHSLLQADETSPCVPLVLYPNLAMNGSPLEFCDEYQQSRMKKFEQAVLPVFAQFLTAIGLGKLVLTYMGQDFVLPSSVEAEVTVPRTLEAPVKLEKKELELFLKHLIDGLSDAKQFPPPERGKLAVISSLIWKPELSDAEKLIRTLQVILPKISSADEETMDRLTVRAVALVNSFMRKIKFNPDQLGNFLNLMRAQDFSQAHGGVGLPDQISVLSLKRVCELLGRSLVPKKE